MTLQGIFFKGKFFNALLLITFISIGFVSSIGFAQDLHPSHNAYNSLTSVVDAMKLERKSCADIGYYPQVGQSICASVPTAENFRSDWDLIVTQTGSSFGLSPLGDWKSEPARGIIHRTYLLGSTDLKVNYDVISSRITIDVLDPELQVQEEARRVVQAEADAAQQQAQAAYDSQYNSQQAAYNSQQSTQVANSYDTTNYATQQTQTPEVTNGYYASNADGTTFVLAESTTANTVTTTEQVVTNQADAYTDDYETYLANYAAQYSDNTANTGVANSNSASTDYAQTVQAVQAAQTSAVVESRSYAPAPAATDGYASTARSSYSQANSSPVTASATTPTTTIAYAYTPTNLITAMGSTTQNTEAFQPNGAWQITNSGETVRIDLYDTYTQTYVRTVYPDQVYTDAGNYYLSISGNAAWALSVWTE